MFGSTITTLPQEDLLGRIVGGNQQEPEPAAAPPLSQPKAVAGQFEDADNDQDDDRDFPPAATTNSVPSSNNPLDWLAAACNNYAKQGQGQNANAEACTNTSAPALPSPSRLQRLISANTSNATTALLEISRGGGAPPKAPEDSCSSSAVDVDKQNNKTFQVGAQQPDPRIPADSAFQAFLLQRQEDARMSHMRGGFLTAGLAARRASSLEPDGTIPPDEEIYPVGAFKSRPRMDVLSHDAHLNMSAGDVFAREGLPVGGLALQEIYRREALVREQRFAAAMAASRLPFGHPLAQAHLGSSLYHQQAGRVMSLLQPLESVPTRSDPMLHLGAPYHDPRINALLQSQLAQRHESDACFRRPSDAAMNLQERRNSDAAMEFQGRRASDASSTALSETHDMNKKLRQEVTHRSRKSWDERMKEMWEFFLTYGHIQVLTRGKHKELGRWLSNARCKIRQGVLPERQLKDIQAMQEWKLDEDAAKEARAMALEEAAKEDPHDDGSLSTANSGKRNSLVVVTTDGGVPRELIVPAASSEAILEDQAGQEDSADTNRSPKRALPNSWSQSFAELAEFKKRFGHCDCKMTVNNPYVNCGKWLASQRSRHKLGQLPGDKVQQLRDLGCTGFGCSDRADDQGNDRSQYRSDEEEAEFDAAIRLMKAAADQKGDKTELPQALPPMSASTTPSNSPPSSPSGCKKEKRVRHSYETRVEHIKAFKAKHGHCKIRLGSLDKHEELLARWLASARSRHRAGQFKEERAAELFALGCDGFEPGSCDPSMASRMDVEAEAIARPENPTCTISTTTTKKPEKPTRTATPSPIPPVDLNGRREEDASEVPPQKKQRVVKEGPKRQSFDDMLQELQSYQYVFGVGCSVPKPDGDGGKLGRWLAFQRRQFLAGKLSADRIEKLRAVGRKEFSESGLVVRAAERAAARGIDQQ